MKEKIETIVYFFICVLTVIGMSYIVITCNKDSNIIFGILFMLLLSLYCLCLKSIKSNGVFWIGVTCVGMGTIFLTLGILLIQQLILFSVPIFFAGIINLIGGVVIKHI